MALSQRTVVDQIEILASGIIQVRSANQIVQTNDDGSSQVIAVSFSRDTAEPGDAVKAQSLLGDKAPITQTVWTQDVVKSYQAAKAVQQIIKQVEASNAELSENS